MTKFICDKNSQKLSLEGNKLNTMKVIYEEHTASFRYNNVRMKALVLKLGIKQGKLQNIIKGN